MANSNNDYLEQLKKSGVDLRIQIPEIICKKVIEQIESKRDRLKAQFPETIIYAFPAEKKLFPLTSHITNLRSGKWKFEILKGTYKKTKKDTIIVLIHAVGSVITESEPASVEHRDGKRKMNNMIKAFSKC